MYVANYIKRIIIFTAFWSVDICQTPPLKLPSNLYKVPCLFVENWFHLIWEKWFLLKYLYLVKICNICLNSVAWHDWAGLDVPSIDHQHDMSIKKKHHYNKIYFNSEQLCIKNKGNTHTWKPLVSIISFMLYISTSSTNSIFKRK